MPLLLLIFTVMILTATVGADAAGDVDPASFRGQKSKIELQFASTAMCYDKTDFEVSFVPLKNRKGQTPGDNCKWNILPRYSFQDFEVREYAHTHITERRIRAGFAFKTINTRR